MRNPLIVTLFILVSGNATADGLLALEPGELKIEIHSPSADLVSTTGEVSVEVEGVASAIGGVQFIDMMLVLDTSSSLRRTDPRKNFVRSQRLA